MTRQAGICVLTAVLAMAVVACGRGHDSGKLTEVQRVRSGMVDVVLLSPRDALRHGTDAFVIELRSASEGTLVDVGTVKGNATMRMAGMPLLGRNDVTRPAAVGRAAT